MTASINEAYHTLRERNSRERYDSKLAAGDRALREAAAASRATARRVSRPTGASAGVATAQQTTSFEDVFDVVRQHRRVVSAIAAGWILVVGSLAWGAITTPNAPSTTIASGSEALTMAADTTAMHDALEEQAVAIPQPEVFEPEPVEPEPYWPGSEAPPPGNHTQRAPRTITIRPQR